MADEERQFSEHGDGPPPPEDVEDNEEEVEEEAEAPEEPHIDLELRGGEEAMMRDVMMRDVQQFDRDLQDDAIAAEEAERAASPSRHDAEPEPDSDRDTDEEEGGT